MKSGISSLVNFAQGGNIVVMAGSGVSKERPTALPLWKEMNADIWMVLRDRLETAIDKPGWLGQLQPIIDSKRKADVFPPAYQAQLIEEMCGDRYFQGLKAFDIDTVNACHGGIGALAATGAIRAIVTTNFDRLIEQALDKRGVSYVVAYDSTADDTGYEKMFQRLKSGDHEPLPILKIHGCVSNHLSMIDTLKQRRRGRSIYLQGCLDLLQPHYWLYLGFSAADLETDKNYLGFVEGAKKSAGAIYVTRPGHSPKRGAEILMEAYSDRGQIIEAQIATFLRDVCQELGKPGPDLSRNDTEPGYTQFKEKLKDWADNKLSPTAAGLCLAAILEANDEPEAAIQILDHLVRKERLERDSDFDLLRLQYGRLGAAWGRAINTLGMDGQTSNISFHTSQSLMQLLNTELQFGAASWLACMCLWMGYGQNAMKQAFWVLKGFLDGRWEGAQPRSDEEAVDGWISAVQVCIFNSSPEIITVVRDTADMALNRAKQSGDVVRTGRVAALTCLALAETTENIPTRLAQYYSEIGDAVSVGDGFTMGMQTLAHGRWLVGIGGLALTNDPSIRDKNGQRSLKLLEDAKKIFINQNMDPWSYYALVQQAKAHADLHQFDEAQDCIDQAKKSLDRFPILESVIYETTGQLQTMWGDPNAIKSFQAAIESAEESGLILRKEMLKGYLRM